MRSVAILVVLCGWIAAAFGAVTISGAVVEDIERAAASRVALALGAAGQDWAVVDADGLSITLSGAAPTLDARDGALAVTQLAVGPGSVLDRVTLPAAENPLTELPPAVLELSRFDGLITLEGLLTPKAEEMLAAQLPAGLVRLTTLAPSRLPDDWAERTAALLALANALDTGTITVTETGIHTVASFPSGEARSAFEREAKAVGLQLSLPVALDLAAPEEQPKPAVFTLSWAGAHLDLIECRLPGGPDLTRVARMLRALSYEEVPECDLLGTAPSGWTDALLAGLTGLASVDDATLHLEGLLLTLLTPRAISAARKAAIEESILEGLPDTFALVVTVDDAQIPRPTPFPMPALRMVWDGFDQLTLYGPGGYGETTGSGRALLAYAQSLFPDARVLDARVPQGRLALSPALALLDALAVLDNGEITFWEDTVTLTGEGTGHLFALREDVSAALAPILQTPDDLRTSLKTVPARAADGTPTEPTSAECAAGIALAKRDKSIVFAPSSAMIGEAAGRLLDQIAEVMLSCPSTRFRIEGHTDSQGSESVNLAISTARAESVLDALLARGIFLDRMEAQGFGEALPIADNDTATGRSRNRRIEFSIIGDST